MLIFYYLFTRNKRLLNVALVLTLVVLTSTAWKRIHSTTTDTITFLNLKKQRAIIFKKGTDAVVLSDLKPADKDYRYSVQPGLDSVRIENVKVYSFAEDINLPYLKKHGNFIRFQNKTVLLLDSAALNANPATVKIHYVYITHTPPISPKIFNQNFKAQLLVIGADNSDRYIATLKQHLQNRKYYVLKRNKALNLVAD